METYFSFIKECLLKFNYPLAHSMTDEELGDIFKPSNRCFLISWLLKLLDGAYEEILENAENNKELMGNLVYEHGFCASREKLPFMTGELPVGEQVKIIFNMFTFVTDIKKCDGEEKTSIVTNDELSILKNTNLNLFPMYGDIKYLKSNERCNQLQELKTEVDSIKAIILSEDKAKAETAINHKFINVVEDFVVKLETDFPKITTVVHNILKDQNVKRNYIFQLYSNSSELMRECSENLKIISQFIKDIIVIRDFVETSAKMNEFANEITDETIDMIQSLYQEIVSVRKYARCL